MIPDGQGQTFQGYQVYAVGHPYDAQPSAAVREVFGEPDGRKRCSPGYVTKIETERPLVWHDCSTVGGFSGSCLVSLQSAAHAAVGLHFGGKEGDRPAGSGLGVSNAAISFAAIQAHPAAEYLRRTP
jgi:endonuclease G, mitochondrial